MGFFDKLKDGLMKTRKSITEKIDQVLVSFGKVDEELFDELEEILITSDLGIDTTMRVIEDIKSKVRERKIIDAMKVKDLLKEELQEILSKGGNEFKLDTKPAVIIVIGVNGVGKTTSIGKIANLYKQQGKKVLLAAGDTFRAAAIDQLEIWAERVGVDVIAQKEGSDPAAVIYDAVQAAKSRKADLLICDTAGRLHTKKNLMEELKKVSRVLDRELPGADRETLLVLDATTGQNAISQAKTFSETADITGIVLTKLDGTAKGGIVVAIKSELDIPVKLIGVGEQLDDLQRFDATEFVEALFS
ncbi:signal recognition particle-docking protein FtsY [Ruminiclostridium cellobioparum]|uniref:Signal recognition particle receptor FtsY n=1 Tax=Ruminiclostridium cellobioparum subsp. termitidis CT1112 TaxID=1195236 RepID=S0FTR4_RUMCE|nr:signal recognition particle-docking protein FtsY [Ruminiclostridium cellobioparum]EMS71888.1 signal recognition particle-docking protein FtsY [Ruminiclostridium cellobioparum subsp. termitidis CT1112]